MLALFVMDFDEKIQFRHNQKNDLLTPDDMHTLLHISLSPPFHDFRPWLSTWCPRTAYKVPLPTIMFLRNPVP